jgi:hypothetical protein
MKLKHLEGFKYLVATALIVVPFMVSAQNSQPVGNGTTGSSAQNTNTGITYECAPVMKNGVQVYGECGWNDLIAAVQKIVKWITIFTLEVSVVVIAWAGYIYMTSGGNPGEIKKANTMFLRVAQGIGLILAAWLIVNLIANQLIQNPNVPKILTN